MRQLTVQNYEAGQRLDRYLTRYMQEASKSFIYKMLRKKNITLNGKKADGTEKLEAGDEIKLFLAEETIIKFQGANPTPAPIQAVSEGKSSAASAPSRANAPGKIPAGTSATSPVQEGVRLQVIYEDGDVIFINKPAGMLSQKAKPEDVSVCEHLIDRMIRKGELTQEALRTFKPGVCNRLDRNTSGIIAAGKSIRGLQALSARFRDRSLEKYYLCLVAGEVKAPRRIRGYLVKDEKTNTVTIRQTPGGDPIVTEYVPIHVSQGYTLLRVQLITGKTHQIRAHLASIGFPILGDAKYGDPKVNQEFRRNYPLRLQLLHSWKLVFPENCEDMPALSGKTITAPLPTHFAKCLRLLGMIEPE